MMTVGLIILGALVGIFVAGPVAWNLGGLIFGEDSLAWRVGWLSWGLGFGILGTLLGTAAALRAQKRLHIEEVRMAFYRRRRRRRI